MKKLPTTSQSCGRTAERDQNVGPPLPPRAEGGLPVTAITSHLCGQGALHVAGEDVHKVEHCDGDRERRAPHRRGREAHMGCIGRGVGARGSIFVTSDVHLKHRHWERS